jgi:hypothetical protein
MLSRYAAALQAGVQDTQVISAARQDMQLHSAAYQDTHQLACIAVFQDMYQHSRQLFKIQNWIRKLLRFKIMMSCPALQDVKKRSCGQVSCLIYTDGALAAVQGTTTYNLRGFIARNMHKSFNQHEIPIGLVFTQIPLN